MFLFLLFCLFSDGLFRLVQFFVYLFFRSVFVALFFFPVCCCCLAVRVRIV